MRHIKTKKFKEKTKSCQNHEGSCISGYIFWDPKKLLLLSIAKKHQFWTLLESGIGGLSDFCVTRLCDCYSCKALILAHHLDTYSGLQWSDEKPGVLPTQSVFLGYLLIGASYGSDFWLMQRARLSGPFRYLEHVRQVNRKFSRDLWKKSFSPKNGVLSEYSNPILSFIFSKSQLFSLFLT